MNKYPLLQSQMGIMAYCIQYPTSTYYNLPFIIELSSEIDINRLCEAWKTLYLSRPVFKTRFEINESGEILQYCDDEMEMPIVVRECKHDELQEYLDEGFVRPFDLFNGDPLSRVEIITTERGIYLLWDIHHLIGDYTLINKVILQEELSLAYEKLELPPESFTLKEAVDLERESFNTDEYESSKEYFLNNFDQSSFNALGNEVYKNPGKMIWALSYLKTDEVDSWCKEHEVKPHMLFQAAFTHVCSVFFRKDDFAYCTIYHGRTDERLMNCYGMFAKTIPLKNADCENASVIEYMRDVYDEMKKGLSNNIYPFTHFCQEVRTQPKLIFNFVAKKNVNYDVIIGENKFQLVHLKRTTANNATNVQIGLKDDNYEIRVESGTSMISENGLKIIGEAIKTVIQNIMSCPDLKINEMPLVPINDDETALKLLELGSGSELLVENDDNIVSAFRKKVAEQPESIAVHFNDAKYSYAQIEKKSNKIANVLKEKVNVKKGDIIGVFIGRNEKMITYPLGIMKTGAIYMPLDKSMPQERLEVMCTDAGIKAIITDDDVNKIDSFTDIILQESDFNTEDDDEVYETQINHEDGAVILYTSGSTGKPKGVILSHGSIINFLRWIQDEIKLTSDDRLSAYASFGFDAHIIDIYASLISGCELFIIPQDVRMDITLLTDFLNEHEITVGFFTTRIAHILNSQKTNMRFILTGGEKINPINIENHKLLNGYGPTECTIYSTYHIAEGEYDGKVIGRPLPNYQLLIIDQNKNLVPPEVPGELLIAGKGVSSGYLNRPEMNAEKFIDYPLTGDINLKAYRTGDLVYLNEEGNIVFLGRNDKLIKLRGYRIELDEIEKIASSYMEIDEVTTKIVNDNLCLYFTSKFHISHEDLKQHLSNFLPEYMVPTHYLQMESFPYNLNSKIDKDKLPDITLNRQTEYEAPVGLLENAIANGISTVLGITEKISRNDEFSQLGGDSISVMMLIVKLREYNIDISVKDVLDLQSVKNIAAKAKYKVSSQKIDQSEYRGFVDTTPIIQHFWDSNFKKPSYFNQAFLYEAKDKIDINILNKAMQAVVNHHDILRAKVKDEKLHVGAVNEGPYFTIETIDSLDYVNETKRLNNELDIINGPLIKLAIFEDESFDYLYIVIHHLIVDGVSWRILIEDLNLAYAQLSNQDSIKLPKKTSSYQDYSQAISDYRNNEELQKQKPYWENTLNNLKNEPHTTIDSNIRKMEKFELRFPKNKSSILQINSSKFYDASINVLFLSAVSKSWNDVMGENKISVRIEGHGREEFDENILIDRTVGWFTTCYPLILECEGNDNGEIIENIKHTVDEVPQNGFGYPILMGIETDVLPLVTFNYLGEMTKVRTGEMFVNKHRSDLAYYTSSENNYGSDININGYSLNHELHFELEYNSERFAEEDIREFGEAFLKTLDEFIISSGENSYPDDIHIFSSHPDKKQLFFIHSANYGSEFFYNIADDLKEDYSLSVIEPYNINHPENSLTSIEEMASKYIEIIKSIQPVGPYYIGGLCFGGAIAHEMAIRLTENNEKVEKLIIFDAHNIEDVNLQNEIIQDQMLYARKYLKDGILASGEISIDDLVYNARLASKIWLDYRPGHYNGEAIYFRATVKPGEGISPVADKMYDYVLARKAGGYENCYDNEKFQIIDVPVEHDNIISKEALKVITPNIKRFIEE